ncbi:putative ER to golgi transport protein [Thermochaetoides thermophila DSM 1495]|uniref:Putative ER to golgi transport protein n=1 Tax=Chaetomium thermophilum (strain DSM 1495 / CBS 144.50 / IMI 039719) TaxID=759272 RepID=G0S2F3_CHATD|nr:putative ER to golgi transport protein [Thermochaetoides thermophila DSM 1495]EGS22186.1 putative ER to golgi transport protein [Thermochaetoides thermophila DSM 1495]
MSEYAMYHALGYGEPLDPNDPSRTTQPAPPQFQPPIAPNPYQQQQQQQAPRAPADTLAAQMGAMSLGDGQHHAPTTAKKKKRDRHAYHTVEAPAGSSQPFNGIPPAGTPATAYLNNDPSVAHSQFPAPVNPPFTPTPASPLEFAARQGHEGVPAAVSTQSGPGSGAGRPSPDEMPSVPVSRDSVQPHYYNNVYPTFQRLVPPPATVSYVAFDQGNASPKFARLTLNSIPATADGLKMTALPLGLILQPLAPLQAGELEIPVLDFGDAGPPRCHRCRAYINPFMVFRQGGNKFVCNLCGYPNDTPPEYFCATSPQGIRIDRDQRPELTRGTVEFLVPKEYWTREPVPLRYLFVIDVTQDSYNKGFLEAFCDGILRALYAPDPADEQPADENGELPRRIPPGAKVGFITYDKEVHFYNVSPALEQAQMIVMPDIEDPFVPLGDGLFVDPYESKAVITSLLTRLPQMFSTIKNPEPALLATLTAAVAALEKTGGKIFCSLSALPTWGPGRLFMRDDGKHPGGEPDKKLFSTEHPAWRKMADKMVSIGAGVDFFMASPSGGYLDIATVGYVAATTGGETFYYPNFIAARDTAKLALEIKHAVTRETGYQALMKVRCSNGLQVSAYHGNFVQHTFGADLEIGVIDADKALGVTFAYDGKLDPKLDAHFQAALLYTSSSGQRRVRCINVVASVAENARDCIKFVDQDAVVTLIAKEASTRLATTSATLKDIRASIQERTIDVLANYRKHFLTVPHPPGQLVMPERLKEFAMYMLAMLKCRAFKGGAEPTDRRVHDMRLIRSVGARELSYYLYPRIIPIHNLAPEDGFPDEQSGGNLRMPASLRASFARVEPGGVYIVDNGQICILWFHAQTSPNLLMDLFGEDKTSLQSLDPYVSELPVLQTHLNAQVRNILEFLRTMRGSKGLVVQIARQGIDGAEFEFARMLVEDRNNEASGYVDWLVNIHRGVQLELAGQRKREDGGSHDSSGLAGFSGLRPMYW